MAETLWTPYHHTHISFLNIQTWIIFAIYNNLHSSGRAFHNQALGLWIMAVMICVHSVTRPLVRSGTDVRQKGLGCNQCSLHPKGVQW